MDYETKVKDLISAKTGVEPDEIQDESYFEDDLNIGELELNEIFDEIEEKFEVDLSEERDEFETFNDLISALNEKLE